MDQSATTAHHVAQAGVDFSKLRIAFIQSGWHADIVARGREAFIGEMSAQSMSARNIDIFDVPGAFEIPLRAQILARTWRYAAIVACGFVVDGGIYRHEFVSAAVIDGLMSVQLDTGVPVISIVLTPQHFHDHDEHRAFFNAHFVTKGKEAAIACCHTIAGHAAALKLTADVRK